MKYSIGIDLGGTNIAAGVVDENMKIVGKANVKTNLPRPADSIADSIKEVALMALVDGSVLMEEVTSVGIGTPGAVNSEGVVEFSSNLGFDDTPLRDMVEERIQKPVYIENDANCAALGEQLAGCGNGVKNFIAVTLGTGVGGGIILDGKLLRGINGAAGEIGHMAIHFGGIACQCGRSGCFEQYASATALVRQTKDALIMDREKESLMWKLINDDPEKVNGITAFAAARKGDERGQEVVEQFIEHLSCGVTNLVNIFQPDMICIGGGISKEGDFLIKPLVEKVERKRYTKHAKKQTIICPATLGNDAGIIGAALLETQV